MSHRGFSRTDALVSILITTLLGLNVPTAILATRSVARKHACTANLRQLGAALHSYNQGYDTLPPAAFWSYDGLDMKQFFWDKERPRSPEVSEANWLQMILPSLGNGPLSNQFHPGCRVVDSLNALARETEVPLFKCPSDSMNGADNHYQLSLSDGTVASFARGNYAINGGGQWIFKSPGVLFNPRPNASHFSYDGARKTFQFWGTGVAGFNKCFSFKDFSNGLSSTVLVDEIRAGVGPADTRGAWALGQIGASVTWGHGIVGDAGAPNIAIDDSDDIIDCRKLHQRYGTDWLREHGMPCCEHCNQNQQAAARSQHDGGVNILMADGVVRFVSNNIDRGLWDAIHSRETPARSLEESHTDFTGENGSYHNEADRPFSKPADKQIDRITNSIGMSFVRIPSGEFIMGIPNEGTTAPANAPPHRVVISNDFYLGRFEVTQEQYMRIMGPHVSWHSHEGGGSDLMPSSDTATNPVDNVTWHLAMEFCQRLSDHPDERRTHRRYRLPTEAEWEYACRAGRENAIPLVEGWNDSDESGEIASKPLREDGKVVITKPVGSFPSNPFGLHDMCGNVFEWCSDWYGSDYYTRSSLMDPRGPGKGYFKIIRGWYWVYTGPARKDNQATSPWRSSPYIGFRVVCVAELHGD